MLDFLFWFFMLAILAVGLHDLREKHRLLRYEKHMVDQITEYLNKRKGTGE